jgi:hypothetical protein
MSNSEHDPTPVSKPLSYSKEQRVETGLTKQKGGLGRIGGKRPAPKNEGIRSNPQETVENDIETQSDDDDDLSQHISHSPKPIPTPKKSKKLGLIGGAAKRKPESPSPDHESGQDDDLSAETEQNTMKKVLPSSPPPPIHPSAPTSSIQRRHVPSPEPELTAEQKANRKREELKRQLDARSKAPAKKKRKF